MPCDPCVEDDQLGDVAQLDHQIEEALEDGGGRKGLTRFDRSFA